MYLSHEAIEEFRRIWFDDYGESLTFEEAEMRAERFLHSFRLLFLSPRTDGTNASSASDEAGSSNS